MSRSACQSINHLIVKILFKYSVRVIQGKKKIFSLEYHLMKIILQNLLQGVLKIDEVIAKCKICNFR